MPAKYGGLGILEPELVCSLEYESSIKATCQLTNHGEFYRTNRNSPDFYRNSTEILPEFKNFTGIQKFYRNSDRIPENR